MEIHISSSVWNIIRVNGLRRIRWTGTVALLGYMKHLYKFLMAEANERNLLEDEGVNRRVEGEKSLGRRRHRWVGTRENSSGRSRRKWVGRRKETFRKTTA